MRTRKVRPWRFFHCQWIIVIILLLCGIRPPSRSNRCHISLFALGSEEDDFLAEILAEEQKQAEELTKMEAEMRELEAMKAQRRQQEQEYQQQRSRMKPGGGGGFSTGQDNGRSSIPSAQSAQFDKLEEKLRRKEAESKQKSMETAKEEEKRKKAEQIAREREAAYEAELARVTDEKAKRRLKRQKLQDNRIVRQILSNSEKGKHYAVVGLGRASWGELEIGPFKFFSVTQGDVKRSYRKVARSVHPDKNRDGRAAEAFDALERSANMLLDEAKKKNYDAKLKRQRIEIIKGVYLSFWEVCSSIMTGISALHKILGPFATPITILTLLLI